MVEFPPSPERHDLAALPQRRWSPTKASWAAAVSLAVLMVGGSVMWLGPAKASPSDLVRQALGAHSATLDRCYRVEIRAANTTITLDDLLTPAGMAALRAVFTDPQHFESPETPESVTQRIAADFARIADRLRAAGSRVAPHRPLPDPPALLPLRRGCGAVAPRPLRPPDRAHALSAGRVRGAVAPAFCGHGDGRLVRRRPHPPLQRRPVRR